MATFHQEITITRREGSFTFEESLAHLVRRGLLHIEDIAPDLSTRPRAWRSVLRGSVPRFLEVRARHPDRPEGPGTWQLDACVLQSSTFRRPRVGDQSWTASDAWGRIRLPA
jgi:hypothetical protein